MATSPTSPIATLEESLAMSENSHVIETTEQMQALHVRGRTNSEQDPSLPLKDGKLVFQEYKLRPENHSLVADRIATFRSCRSEIERIGTPFDEIPDEFLDLIAVLAQDSDESLATLSSRLNDLLSPFERNEQVSNLFLDSIERAVKKVAHRVKYGLSSDVLGSLEGAPASIPMHLAFYRWEAMNISHFPIDIQEAIHRRVGARQKVSDFTTHAFQELPQDHQLRILLPKQRRSNGIEDTQKTAEELEQEKEKRRKKEEEKKKREEERKAREEEKRKREEEKKAREEEKKHREEEKKKKEQSQLRLTSLFSKTTEEKPIHTSASSTATTTGISFFPPFFVKEHVQLAPKPCSKPPSPDFEKVLSSYAMLKDSTPSEEEIKACRERYLLDMNAACPPAPQQRSIKQNIDLRVLLSESAENNADVFDRKYLKSLLKMKLFQFAEDVRPAYYGTWTKISKAISGRSPFAIDENIDYDHDSEAEWEPEGEGEDINSGDEDEDDAPPDIIDPEDSDWLVPEGYLSEDEGTEDAHGDDTSRVVSRPAIRPASRKNVAMRQVIVGPCLDDDDESMNDDTLRQFETKLLFDTPSCGYDPFLVETTTAPETNKTPGFTEEHTNELITIIEGKADAIPKLISEAKSNWLLRDVSKRQIEAKIKDLAVKEKRGSDTKPSWYIKKDNPQQ